MKILITGVHGFVGSNLVTYLAKENEIYGLDIVAPEKRGVAKTYSWDDLDKSGEIPEVDAIIHLAGKAHDTKNKSAVEVYFKVNTGLTQNIFDWYLAHPTAKKFIQFSTVKSAADRVEGEFLTEECIPTPVGPYGESKIAAENYIIEKFAPEALNRPFHNFTDEDAVAFAEVQGARFSDLKVQSDPWVDDKVQSSRLKIKDIIYGFDSNN